MDASFLSMTDRNPRLRNAAIQSSKDPRRSPLFHWLRKHYRLLEDTQTNGCREWAPLLAKALAAGVTDDKGTTPTERVMRDTWRKVRKHVQSEQAAQSAKPPRKLQPRDMPADWRPTPLAAASLPGTTPPSRPGSPPLAASEPGRALVPLSHPDQVRVVGQASFGVITSGPLTPEPDYTGMGVAERKIARINWTIAKRQTG